MGCCMQFMTIELEHLAKEEEEVGVGWWERDLVMLTPGPADKGDVQEQEMGPPLMAGAGSAAPPADP